MHDGVSRERTPAFPRNRVCQKHQTRAKRCSTEENKRSFHDHLHRDSSDSVLQDWGQDNGNPLSKLPARAALHDVFAEAQTHQRLRRSLDEQEAIGMQPAYRGIRKGERDQQWKSLTPSEQYWPSATTRKRQCRRIS